MGIYGYQTLIYGEIQDNKIVTVHVKLDVNNPMYPSNLTTTTDFEVIVKHFKPSQEEYQEIIQAIKDYPESKWYIRTGSFSTYEGFQGSESNWIQTSYNITGDEYNKLKDYIEYPKLINEYQKLIQTFLFSEYSDHIGKEDRDRMITILKKNNHRINAMVKLTEKIMQILERLDMQSTPSDDTEE